MERRLSLEQRTERLVQRSQALLRPRPRGPERAEPVLGSAPSSPTVDDPLVRWRLRRCRGAEPAPDAPLVGRALLDSAASQRGLQGVPRERSCDPPEAPQPIRSHCCKPLHRVAFSAQPGSQEPVRQEPCWWSHDSHEALWPRRSSSLDTLQGALYSQSRDSHEALRVAPYLKSRDSPEALWPISSSHCTSLHQGAPTWLLHLHGHRGAGKLWCSPAPEGAVGDHGGRQKLPLSPQTPHALPPHPPAHPLPGLPSPPIGRSACPCSLRTNQRPRTGRRGRCCVSLPVSHFLDYNSRSTPGHRRGL